MISEQLLEEIATDNQCFFAFDLGTCPVEEVVSSYYKQYQRDEGDRI